MSGAEAERRQWPRIPASLLGNVTASIMAGPDVKLVNLSRGGALMEVAARYPMRSKVRLKLMRSTGEITQVPGTVSWAKVGSITNGKINYLLAVIFEKSIDDLDGATGVNGIENEALAAMPSDPGYGDDEIHAVQSDTPVPAAPPVRALADAEPSSLFIEEDLSGSLLSPSHSPTPLPSAGPDPVQEPVVSRDLVDRAELSASESRAEDLRRELERAAADVAALSAARDNLSTQLRAFDDERTTLRGELEAARQRWEDEKTALAADAAGSLARLTELEAALHQHRQSGGQALADQQALAQTLSMRLDAIEVERASLRGELSTERQRWEDDRAALAREAADAVAKSNELQGTLHRREQEHTQALDEARDRYQSLQERLQALEAESAAWNGRELAWQREQEQWQQERERWQQERSALAQQLTDATERVSLLESDRQSWKDEHAAALAEQQAATLSLAAQIESMAAERLEIRRELDAERAGREEERARACAELNSRAEAFQAALEAREQIHADALAGQQSHFESLIAELVQASNDQQTEYQQLMAERTAAVEELVTRAESAEAEVIRVRAEADQQRAALDRRYRELAAQLEATEAVTVAQETRYRAIRQEAERLVALLSPPVQAQLPVGDVDDIRSDRESVHAVA